MSQIDKYKEIYANKTFERDGRSVNYSENRIFDGAGTKRILGYINAEKEKRDFFSVLDYGCGSADHWFSTKLQDEVTSQKQNMVQWLGSKLTAFHLYDPAHPVYSRPSSDKYDIIICTDVMEHVPENELVEVLQDIKFYCYYNSTVIFSIPLNESRNCFADGENMHCTIKTKDEWEKLIKSILKCNVIVNCY